MSLFDWLLGRKSPGRNLLALLKATVWDSGRHEYWVVFEHLHPECRSVEYIRLVAHYYAKILFNFGSGHDEMGQSARACIHSMRNLLRQEIDQTLNVMQLADIADTASVVPYVAGRKGAWKVEAVLYFVSSVRRHITTDFPRGPHPLPWRNTTAQQTVFSLFALIQESMRHLSDPKERRMLDATLRNMQRAYEGEVDWSTLDNLALIPTMAYADAVGGVGSPFGESAPNGVEPQMNTPNVPLLLYEVAHLKTRLEMALKVLALYHNATECAEPGCLGCHILAWREPY